METLKYFFVVFFTLVGIVFFITILPAIIVSVIFTLFSIESMFLAQIFYILIILFNFSIIIVTRF
jgi:hypothetical protein